MKVVDIIIKVEFTGEEVRALNTILAKADDVGYKGLGDISEETKKVLDIIYTRLPSVGSLKIEGV